ncbi:MAG: hypothetical protein LBB58_02235 [Cellulomonadaceae bacterium]|nr:hypothetical protein [Cellulomonadaceae bacterium]
MDTAKGRKGALCAMLALTLAASLGAMVGALATGSTAFAAPQSDGGVKAVTLPAELPSFTGGKVKIVSPYSVVRVGHKLTAAATGFTPTPKAYAYRWYRDGVQIADAFAKDYTVKAADLGQRISVKVTAEKLGNRNTTVTSNPSAIVLEHKTLIPESDAALFSRLVGGYTMLSGTGDVAYDLRIAQDGSFTYSELAMANYNNSLPANFECPTAICFYQSAQIGKFGKVSRNVDGSFEVQVLSASGFSTQVGPGKVLSVGEKGGSVIEINPIFPFAVGQSYTVEPTKGKAVPDAIKDLACEQYRKICENGKWTGWTFGDFHSYGK